MLQMGSICFSNATPAMLRAKVDGKKKKKKCDKKVVNSGRGCGVNAGGRMKYLCGRSRDCGKTFDKVLYPRSPPPTTTTTAAAAAATTTPPLFPFGSRLVSLFSSHGFSEPTAARPLALGSLSRAPEKREIHVS